MFYRLLIICVFFTLGSTNHIKNKPIVQFSEVETENIVKAVLHCASINNLNAATLFNEIREGSYEATKEFQHFMHCTFQNAGHLRDDDGHVDADKIFALFPKDVNVKEIVYDCSNEEGNDKYETSFKFFKCFQDKSPVGVKFA